MKNEKKFKFDAQQAELINQSFNDFKNDTIKSIAASNMVGGKWHIYIRIYLRHTSGVL